VPDLRALLAEGHPHVADGAMGTLLYAAGMPLSACFDELNVRRPEVVSRIHVAYVEAGAELVETNTFGASPPKLAHHGLAAETEALNEAAARLARDAVAGRAAVVGSVGPLGLRLAPFGELTFAEAVAAFGRQVDGLLAGGVDGLILETFSDIVELEAAWTAARERSDLPVIASLTLGGDDSTAYGTAPEVFGPRLAALGVDAVGVNCSVGPAVVLEAIERLRGVVDLPSSQCRTRHPREIDGRQIYVSSPEHVATYARRMVEAGRRSSAAAADDAGARPGDRRFRPQRAVRAGDGRARPSSRQRPPATGEPAGTTPAGATPTTLPAAPGAAPDGAPPAPLAERSGLGARLAAGAFIRTVEIVPPRGPDPSTMIAQARALRAAGVDAVNVPDGPRAQSRMGALMSGLLIEREAGIEAIVHYTCRDRNFLGMLSDTLGAAAVGLHNVLAVTGDPEDGPLPDATAVFDIDSIGLVRLSAASTVASTRGNAMTPATRCWRRGQPGGRVLDREIRRFAAKVEAGADFAISQPVFDLDQLDRFLRATEGFGIPVLAGIWPLVSLRNAEFLANEVPGVSIPPATLARMQVASERGRDAALTEGVAIARELIAAVRPRVAGVQVAAPLGRVPIALETLAP
jgi:homocysteine S-methyltransferase